MKIITIVGARPQFIKAASVSKLLRESGINEIIIHTGQHYDKSMSDVFFNELDIPKEKYNLKINNLTYGDTNSTLAGALAGKKLNIKIVHIEAGLRSFNLKMPEEINRIITDRISNVLFCPSKVSEKNLINEGQHTFDCEVIISGDVMKDAVQFFLPFAKKNKKLIDKHGLIKNQFCLLTLHRQENTDSPKKLKRIANAINKISKNHSVIMPVHPRTKAALKNNKLELNATLIPPVSYLEMLSLLDHCGLVMTDSGGLQKEAYYLNKFCLTLREETEWVELVESGYNFLVGSNIDSINENFNKFFSARIKEKQEIYGGGNAVKKIVKYFLKEL